MKPKDMKHVEPVPALKRLSEVDTEPSGIIELKDLEDLEINVSSERLALIEREKKQDTERIISLKLADFDTDLKKNKKERDDVLTWKVGLACLCATIIALLVFALVVLL